MNNLRLLLNIKFIFDCSTTTIALKLSCLFSSENSPFLAPFTLTCIKCFLSSFYWFSAFQPMDSYHCKRIRQLYKHIIYESLLCPRYNGRKAFFVVLNFNCSCWQKTNTQIIPQLCTSYFWDYDITKKRGHLLYRIHWIKRRKLWLPTFSISRSSTFFGEYFMHISMKNSINKSFATLHFCCWDKHSIDASNCYSIASVNDSHRKFQLRWFINTIHSPCKFTKEKLFNWQASMQVFST